MADTEESIGLVLYCHTIAELGGLAVAPFLNGQRAFCLANKYTYVLQNALVPAVAADGYVVVGALGDSSRQWVKQGLLTEIQTFKSDTIDLATVHTQSWGTDWPVLPGYAFVSFTQRNFVTDVAGTHVLIPTMQVGIASPYLDQVASSPIAVATLNAWGATGTKPFSYAVATNQALIQPSLTALPTVSVTIACSAACRLSVRTMVNGLIIPIP